MDLTIPIDNVTLNIRVNIVLQTQNGFLFFKSKGGHYALVGGRVKAGENSLSAAQRELKEETGLDSALGKFKLIGIIENFYEGRDKDQYNNLVKFQEIGFIYLLTEKINLEQINPDFVKEFDLLELTKEEIPTHDIRPQIIREIILENKLDQISHYII